MTQHKGPFSTCDSRSHIITFITRHSNKCCICSRVNKPLDVANRAASEVVHNPRKQSIQNVKISQFHYRIEGNCSVVNLRHKTNTVLCTYSNNCRALVIQNRTEKCPASHNFVTSKSSRAVAVTWLQLMTLSSCQCTNHTTAPHVARQAKVRRRKHVTARGLINQAHGTESLRT